MPSELQAFLEYISSYESSRRKKLYLHFEEVQITCVTVKSIFIHVVPIFVGRLIHEIKNPTSNETWEAV